MPRTGGLERHLRQLDCLESFLFGCSTALVLLGAGYTFLDRPSPPIEGCLLAVLLFTVSEMTLWCIAVTLHTPVATDNTLAVDEGLFPFACAGTTAPDIWYTFTSASTNDLRFELCGSSYDTAMEVFDGSCTALNLIECNDDSCGLQSQIDITGIPAGTAFTIRVGGWNGATGSGAISITETSSPPPGVVGNPTPTDGANGISVDQDLSWSAGSGATSYDVYLGTNPALGLFAGDLALGSQAGHCQWSGRVLGSAI